LLSEKPCKGNDFSEHIKIITHFFDATNYVFNRICFLCLISSLIPIGNGIFDM